MDAAGATATSVISVTHTKDLFGMRTSHLPGSTYTHDVYFGRFQDLRARPAPGSRHRASALAQQAQAAQLDTYKRSMSTCLNAKGYSVN